MRILLAAVLAMSPVVAVAGHPPHHFHVVQGPLAQAVATVGATAGINIGLTDPSLAATRVPAIDGVFTVSELLRRLLKGSGATYVFRDPVTVVIVRLTSAGRPPPTAPAPSADDQILVTGSKRSALLRDYAGSVDGIDADSLPSDRMLHGSDGIVDQLPVMASTHLGPGRDKLFIRGIADSSFAGPTQATVGQYLGDVRLNYNAPDPDLALYDIRSVEVLEGPQGTLYGAGSLGGIVRLEPEVPELTRFGGSVLAGASTAAHGAPGGDGALVVNLPIVQDALGLRIVGYGGIDGGYVDDPSKGLRDINRTFTRGVRATLRWRPAAGWTVDFGGIMQFIDSRDGQYVDRGLPPLTRSSTLPQPFDNDYGLAGLVLRHEGGSLSLTSATSFVNHEVDTVYDATTAPATPLRYESDDQISILSNETRLSHRGDGGLGWVAGVELMRSEDRMMRSLGPPSTPVAISGTRNVVEEASVFGEATLPLGPRWSVTAGARVGYTRQDGELIDRPDGRREPHRDDVAALPSLAVAWRPDGRLSLYAKYQEGYRPGGLSVQGDQAQRFEADSVATWEVGARWGGASSVLSATVAASYAHWEDIQADLVDVAGLPYTANIGSGYVAGLEARASWRPLDGLQLDASLFADRSRLARPAPAYVGEGDATLPNVPAFLGRAAARYGWRFAGHAVELSGSARYVGRSRLGVGSLLGIRQGGYLDTRLGAAVELGRARVSLDVANVLDARGNVFAVGDPFTLATRSQATPQRPRTVRLGFSRRF